MSAEHQDPGLSKRSLEEGRSLGSSEVVTRAETVIFGRVTANGYPRSSKTVDGSFEHVAVIVKKIVGGGGWQIQGSHDERSDLCSSHPTVRTERSVRRGVAPESDPGLGDSVYSSLENVAVVVFEVVDR